MCVCGYHGSELTLVKDTGGGCIKEKKKQQQSSGRYFDRAASDAVLTQPRGKVLANHE